jgi:hypothetical protein
VATLTLGITCGITITSNDDPYIDLAKNAQYILDNAGSIGITAIDIFPVRKLSSGLLEYLLIRINSSKSAPLVQTHPIIEICSRVLSAG